MKKKIFFPPELEDEYFPPNLVLIDWSTTTIDADRMRAEEEWRRRGEDRDGP